MSGQENIKILFFIKRTKPLRNGEAPIFVRITLNKERAEFAVKKRNITENDFVCTVCRSTISVSDNGNVYPCEGWQDYIVGNLKETSLKDIWENSEKVQYLRALRYRDFTKCIQCSDKEFCTMCLVRNANENPQGDPLVVNEFFCKIAKLNKQISLEQKIDF